MALLYYKEGNFHIFAPTFSTHLADRLADDTIASHLAIIVIRFCEVDLPIC